MLNELHIENIAVIQRADICFGPGLNVLTGETGAGKSIVIDSIEAALGARTGRELVRAGAEKGVVTAVFDGGSVSGWLEENELDEEDELILSRRIGAEGKSACRISGQPATASQLRELGSLLLDIHGQNDGRALLDENRHREYLDSFGVLAPALEAYRQRYGRWQETQREIRRLTMDELEKAHLTERLQQQVEELERANLRPGEEAELSARRDLLKNAGKITEVLDGAYDALYGSDPSALELTREAESLAGRAADMSPELRKAEESIREAGYLLEDAAETLRDFRESLDFSPEEYDRLESRLAQLRRLEKKYGLDEQGLADALETCRARLDEMEYADDRLEKLSRELEQRRKDAVAAAAELTRQRAAAGERLQKRIVEELRELNMPAVRFAVELAPLSGEPGFGPNGGDEVRFLMSANAGGELGRISRIASGGELSRIMLAMKNVFAENDSVPTMVFDEIDTGVSGIAAQRVGEKLAQLSKTKQVLCVTHLPQIAAMADTHFVISKAERDGKTYTSVTPLDDEGRCRELARLHGGDHVTELTLQSAAEQLEAARRFKAEK